jgi:LysR family transcriptional regulator, glycine cleavage system transcriptional activator
MRAVRVVPKREDLCRRDRKTARAAMRAPNHLNALRALEAVARHLSYVGAAEELNVTPAAIGSLVRGLEETLGTGLFHRSQGGPARLELTDAARVALPDLQAGFDHLARAFDRLQAAQARTAIGLTVPPSFADKWLLPRVERFQASHPHVDLRVDTSPRLVDFSADRIDLGIRYGLGHWAGLSATRLFSDNFFPVCAPVLASGRALPRSAGSLGEHALIHDVSMRAEPAFPTWRAWLARFAHAEQGSSAAGLDAERGLQINDSAAVIQACIAGSGIGLGRSHLVATDLAAGRLVRPFGDALACELAYYVVHRDDARGLAPAVAAFKSWLIDEAANDAAGGRAGS